MNLTIFILPLVNKIWGLGFVLIKFLTKLTREKICGKKMNLKMTYQ